MNPMDSSSSSGQSARPVDPKVAKTMDGYRTVCGELGIRFTDLGDKFRAGFGDEGAVYAPGYVIFMISDGLVAKCIVSSEYRVPLNCRRIACKYIAHVNFGLSEGNFQLDLSDGELRFVISYITGDAMQVNPVLKHMLKLAVSNYSPVAGALATLLVSHREYPEACLNSDISDAAAAAVAAV